MAEQFGVDLLTGEKHDFDVADLERLVVIYRVGGIPVGNVIIDDEWNMRVGNFQCLERWLTRSVIRRLMRCPNES